MQVYNNYNLQITLDWMRLIEVSVFTCVSSLSVGLNRNELCVS